MPSVLYVYVPVLSRVEVRAMLHLLSDAGYSVTHLGKKDPPNKWSDTFEEAEEVILSGSDMTLWTFIRDAKRQLEVTVEIHRDPRWRHSTISASSPEEEQLRLLGVNLSTRIRSFATILGRRGDGKNQAWTVLSLSQDCPPELAASIA